MSTLLERLHHLPVCWDDAVRERREAADMIIALQIEIALLHATVNSQRRERDRLLEQVNAALNMTRQITKATQ